MDFDLGTSTDAGQVANSLLDIALHFVYPYGSLWVLADGRRPPLGDTRGMRQRGSVIKRGSTYTAIYANPKNRDPESGRKKPTWRAFKTKEQAEAFLDVQLGALRTNTHVAPTQATWGEIMTRFEADFIDYAVLGNKMSPSTARSYKSILNKHLRPYFGEARAQDMTVEKMRGWGRHLFEVLVTLGTETDEDGAPIANKTITNHINLMSKVCDWAKLNAFTTTNWVHDAQLVRPKRAKLTIDEEDAMLLDLDEIDRCCAFTRDPNANTTAKALIGLGLMAGLRRGEIAAIQWACIDWTARTLRVMQAISDGKIGPPKTEASAATIIVPATLLRILQEHQDAMKAAGRSVARSAYILTRDTPRGATPPGRKPTTLPPDVFHPDELSEFWEDHVRVPLELRATSTPHAMRHSYASILILEHGHNLKYVQAQMRHASFNITMDTYGHLFKTNNDVAMLALDARFGPKVVTGAFGTGTAG